MVIQDPIGLYCSRQQWKGYADALSLVKTLRSNRASNLAKCSNFFPFTLALLASPHHAARPFYWQVGMFALCIASPRFIPNREKDSFSEEEQEGIFFFPVSGNENFFPSRFCAASRIDGLIFVWVCNRRSRKSISCTVWRVVSLQQLTMSRRWKNRGKKNWSIISRAGSGGDDFFRSPEKQLSCAFRVNEYH